MSLDKDRERYLGVERAAALQRQLTTALMKIEELGLDNSRLRKLIAATAATHEYCPWCGGHKLVSKHVRDCPAFTSDGWVK